MKTLYVVRHAKSSWDHPHLSDSERPLNQRGLKDAPGMGSRLYRAGIRPAIMISSPARRAMDTARLIALELNYPESRIKKAEKLYFGGIRGMLEVVRELDDRYTSVMLFSHNPTIEGLLDRLVGGFYEHVPTCAAAGIQFQVDRWKDLESGELLFFDYPKKNKL